MDNITLPRDVLMRVINNIETGNPLSASIELKNWLDQASAQHQDAHAVWAFEWCYCVYESGWDVESLHATKSGAYHAMRKALLERLSRTGINWTINCFPFF